MKGYKALYKGLASREGLIYELGKTFCLDSEIEWGKNGFHFCRYPEDTFRYLDCFNEEIELAEVEGSGEMLCHNDEYEGYYDMYVCSRIIIKRIISREEFFNMIVSSKSDFRVRKLVRTLKLLDDEVKYIENNFPNLQLTIDYCQKNKKLTFD